ATARTCTRSLASGIPGAPPICSCAPAEALAKQSASASHAVRLISMSLPGRAPVLELRRECARVAGRQPAGIADADVGGRAPPARLERPDEGCQLGQRLLPGALVGQQQEIVRPELPVERLDHA